MKRLDGGEATTQTLRVIVRRGTAAGQTNGANPAVAGTTGRAGQNVSTGLVGGNGAKVNTATLAAAVPTQIVSNFPQAEAPKFVERQKSSGNRFAGIGPVTQYQYDANGNLTKVIDPLGRATLFAYDHLNRRTTATDPAGGVTAYGYDGLNQTVSVTDPRNLATTYTVDGLGNLTTVNSPDSGLATASFNAAGQAMSRTDAVGQTTTYTYDSLGRLARTVYQDGSSADHTYDQGTNGIGRLSRTDERGADGTLMRSRRLEYDALGRIVADTRTIAGAGADYTTAYRYAQGRLTGLTYPSGRRIDYGFDAAGRISEIRLTDQGQSKTLASNIAYRPFGGVASHTNGAGRTLARSYDQDGRIVGVDVGAQRWQLTVDAASRITALANNASPPSAGAYAYDALDRLTQATLPTAANTYAYDANGNRTAATVAGAGQSYTIAATSNRLAAVNGTAYSHDANGSVTGDGARQYAYDPRGRLTRAILNSGTTRFEVNALGQRVRKIGSEDRVFIYDLTGHLIAETAPDGSNARDYVWLGDLPVAVVQ